MNFVYQKTTQGAFKATQRVTIPTSPKIIVVILPTVEHIMCCWKQLEFFLRCLHVQQRLHNATSFREKSTLICSVQQLDKQTRYNVLTAASKVKKHIPQNVKTIPVIFAVVHTLFISLERLLYFYFPRTAALNRGWKTFDSELIYPGS